MHAGLSSLITMPDFSLGLGTRLRSFQLPQTLSILLTVLIGYIEQTPTDHTFQPLSPFLSPQGGTLPGHLHYQRTTSTVQHLKTVVIWSRNLTCLHFFKLIPNELMELRYCINSIGLICNLILTTLSPKMTWQPC